MTHANDMTEIGITVIGTDKAIDRAIHRISEARVAARKFRAFNPTVEVTIVAKWNGQRYAVTMWSDYRRPNMTGMAF